jgi:hypothetical protein
MLGARVAVSATPGGHRHDSIAVGVRAAALGRKGSPCASQGLDMSDALARNPIHHAIVLGAKGVSNSNRLDLTENLPLDLYPDQDVLIAKEPAPVECIREHFPERTLYRATPGHPVSISPLR